MAAHIQLHFDCVGYCTGMLAVQCPEEKRYLITCDELQGCSIERPYSGGHNDWISGRAAARGPDTQVRPYTGSSFPPIAVCAGFPPAIATITKIEQ